ncbi:hypothetical protein FHR32_006806 [Streptosporangium album]|uniref:Transposase putative helix-turn-helix domain-containing protein n=1 Tax=Streptosporangium album TaxID=47479 RepID=A0A7W7WDI9_9ACTN|nr:hypothetical protein [Streptosporangium album]
MAQSVKRGFKYRFYPTPEQAAEFARTFGCARLIYNKDHGGRLPAPSMVLPHGRRTTISRADH